MRPLTARVTGARELIFHLRNETNGPPRARDGYDDSSSGMGMSWD